MLIDPPSLIDPQVIRGAEQRPSTADTLPALVAAATTGDHRAWSALVERFAPLVTSVVRTFRVTPADADDIRQTVWLYLLEHLADLREPRALPGWIVTTTRREATRVLSGGRRVQPVDPQEDRRLDGIDSRDVAADLLDAERRQAVRDGLSELPTRHRELLLLTVADSDIPYRQISRRLGIPTGSICPDLAQARRYRTGARPGELTGPLIARSISAFDPSSAHSPAIRSVSVMPGPCPSRMYHSVPNEYANASSGIVSQKDCSPI